MIAEPQIGDLIDDRYEIEAVLGRGGMGTVYRARHRFTGVQVALKVIKQELVDAEGIGRFLAEARAPGAIGHPAIVAITDANHSARGLLFLAMELLSGRSLRAAMREGLDAAQVRRIGLELLDALAAAHARGFVHRDLKPENVFLAAPGGAVRLLDFGIMKVLGTNAFTMRGVLLGTVEYMAPEQLHDAARVDLRADLWSVGVILYELLAGLRPFAGATLEEKYRALAADEPMPIAEVADVSPAVSAFFARALARDPAQRFQSAPEMAAALRALDAPGQRSDRDASPTLGSGPQWTRGAPGQGGAHAAPSPTAGGPHAAPGHPHAAPPPTSGGTHAAPGHPHAVPGGAAPSSKRRGWLIAVAIASVALIGGGIALGATCGSSRRAPSETAAANGAATSTTDAAAATAPDRCAAVCKRLADCNLAQRSCEQDCRTKLLLVDCIDRATSCAQLATCAWKWMCSAEPAGAERCWPGVKCIEACGADARCRCTCVKGMAPPSANLLAQLFLCRTDCGDDLTCFAERCQRFVQPCFDDT